jgi:hypothetical protein
MAIRIVLVTALLNMVLEAQGAIASPVTAGSDPWWSAAEHLTLEGAMVIAITILWRAYQQKDALLVKSTEAVTSALAASSASNAELRGIIKESVDANRSLRESIDRLKITIERTAT